MTEKNIISLAAYREKKNKLREGVKAQKAQKALDAWHNEGPVKNRADIDLVISATRAELLNPVYQNPHYTPKEINDGIAQYRQIEVIEKLLPPLCDQDEVVDFMRELEQKTAREIEAMLLYSHGEDWNRSPAFFLALAHVVKNKGLYARRYGGRM